MQRGTVRSAQRFGEKALSRGLLGREKEVEGGRRWNPPPDKENATYFAGWFNFDP